MQLQMHLTECKKFIEIDIMTLDKFNLVSLKIDLKKNCFYFSDHDAPEKNLTLLDASYT